MLGKVLNPKYVDLGSLVVTVNIKGVSIQKMLIDLGEELNVMTKDTMFKLNLHTFLRHTTMVLQLEDSSIVCPEDMLGYISHSLLTHGSIPLNSFT